MPLLVPRSLAGEPEVGKQMEPAHRAIDRTRRIVWAIVDPPSCRRPMIETAAGPLRFRLALHSTERATMAAADFSRRRVAWPFRRKRDLSR